MCIKHAAYFGALALMLLTKFANIAPFKDAFIDLHQKSAVKIVGTGLLSFII